MTPDPSSPSPADSVTKVLVVADCENKEKLLSEVRAYQMVDRGRKDASSGESSPGVVEVKDGPDFTLTFCSDEPPHLLGEGKFPQPLSYIAGGIGT
ncbi:MAG: hypothetical protein QGH70_08835 [Nitrospinota bacterium]|jgi:hypothetical protein|nr:hypothetical protein [Nitrospinota bacterium]